MKIFLFLFCFLLIFNVYSENEHSTDSTTLLDASTAKPESVFTYDIKKDIIYSVISLGVFFTPNFIDISRDTPNLNRNDVNIIDRGLMFPYNSNLVNLRKIIILGNMTLPIITPLAGEIRNNFDTWITYGLMYTQAWFLLWGTDSIINKLVGRYTPASYFRDHSFASGCFPSGSTAGAFMPATFLSYTFTLEYPDSKFKIPIYIGSYSIAATVGVLSILSGKHFLTDVLAGAALGAFYGWLLPTLHLRNNNDNRISFFITGNEIIAMYSF